MRKILLLSMLLVLSSELFAQRYVDLDKTLFGIEYSFQDREIVNEPGRMTMTTPYKQAKLKEMLSHYVKLMNLPESAISKKTSWKPGFYVDVPQDGKYIINTEPVTIEFNSTPKRLNEILMVAKPIYEAADLAGLKPYVNPAAERSGMGHIHVGGWTLGDSPFYRNENLLRNVLAFFHKHPSLLYGFAEAYDLGNGSNIETLHNEDRQLALKEIMDGYDSWVKASPQSIRGNGFLGFIDLVKNSKSPVQWTYGSGFDGFFAHYRFINLEHLESLSPTTAPTDAGKYTVEFRLIRPPPSAAHAHALARLLATVMEYLAKPDHLENFKMISAAEFSNFMSGTKIASDWEEVKKILRIKDPLLDSMVSEMVENVHSKVVTKDPKKGFTIFEAYSEKELKGHRFEIRIDANDAPNRPQLQFQNEILAFEKVHLGKKDYWIAVLDPDKQGIPIESLRNSPTNFLKNISLPIPPILKCSKIFLNAG